MGKNIDENQKKRREKRNADPVKRQEYLNYLKNYREKNKSIIDKQKKDWYDNERGRITEKKNSDYHILRENAIQELGGKCVRCETIENLEFNHIDPLIKTREASGNANLRAKEYEKCELLCKKCHREWTNAEARLSRKYWLESLSSDERRKRISETL